MSHGVVKKRGYLLKLPVTGVVKKWAKRWCVLFATSHEGVVRIEYYTDEISERSQIGKRTIPLRDSSKIQQTVGDKAHPYVFEFTTQLGQHIFAAESQPELDEWLDGIRDSVHEDRMKRKMNRQSKKVADSQAPARPPQPQGGNRGQSDTGYTPVVAGGFSKGSTHTASNITSGTYRVTLEENDTTDEHNLHGSFNLILAPTTIALADVDTGKPIYKWSYKNLRSFGKQSGRFNFDVGKTQQGGTGSYRCITTCSKEIFGVVNRNIKTIRERLEASRKDSKPVRHSRNSGVADDSIPGKYRASQNLEDVGASTGKNTEQLKAAAQNGKLSNEDVENNYTLADEAPEDPDIAALYAKVQKRPKGETAPSQGQQVTEAAASTTAQSNRFSYDTSLDARDSALIQLDGPMLDLEALTPKKPAPDLSNIMDLELNNDFFAQTSSTAATGVDPWGGGQATGTSHVQSSPWSMQQGGGQQYTQGGGQQYGGQQFAHGGGQQFTHGGGQSYMQGGGQRYMQGGGQQFGGYGQPAGYAHPAQGQTGAWSMAAQGQQRSGFGAPPQVPAQQQQAQAQAPQKVLSQDEFDKLWDELCTPTTNF